jgi:hypothetical protein
MFLHLASSKLPIYARCRNIKYTDMSKMQKHQKYRYMQDAETSNIPIYARCRNIKNTDICKMQKHQEYRYMQDEETSKIPIYARCRNIKTTDICNLMFLHLAYIGIFDVSASCIYQYF